eukprot:scaffold48258_cov30-Tisochrysis_lutea.AAC.2
MAGPCDHRRPSPLPDGTRQTGCTPRRSSRCRCPASTSLQRPTQVMSKNSDMANVRMAGGRRAAGRVCQGAERVMLPAGALSHLRRVARVCIQLV